MAKVREDLIRKVQVRLNMQYSEAFVKKARVVNNEVQKAVNAKLDLFFSSMDTYGLFGGEGTPKWLTKQYVGDDGVTWKGLITPWYKAQKNNANRFFVNTGELKRNLTSITGASKVLGGYSIRTAKYTDDTGNLKFNTKGVLQNPDQELKGKLKATFEVNVMGKLDRRIATKSHNKFLDQFSTDELPISVKLGEHFKQKPHYRSLLLPYARFYTKVTLAGVIRSKVAEFGD